MTDAGDFNKCPINAAFDQNVILPNDVPFLGCELSGFPGPEVNMFSSLGYQTPDNMIPAHYGVTEATHFDSIYGNKRDRNFFDDWSDGVRNFQMNGLDHETKYSSEQLMDIHRSDADFSSIAPRIPQNLDIVQRAYGDQVRSDASQFDGLNKLDGRFLSLGTNSSLDIQSDVCGSNVNHNSVRSFSPHGQLANHSMNNLGGSLSEFQNDFGGFTTHYYDDNMTSFYNDHDVLQATTSGFHRSSIPAPPGGEINRQHFAPMPSRTSVSGIGMEARFSSVDTSEGYGSNTAVPFSVSGDTLGFPFPSQRRMQRIPFDSSSLRSQHQTSNQLQNSYLRTEMALPSFGGIAGEPSSRNQSGPLLGSTAISAAQAAEGDMFYAPYMVHPACQIFPPNYGPVLNSAGQGGAVTVQSEPSHPSIALSNESHKRRLELPPPPTAQYQRRKIMPDTSSKTFSPYLLQDALGQTVEPVPPFTGSASPSLNPPAPVKGYGASGSSMNQEAFGAAARSIGVSTTRGSTSACPTGSEELTFRSSTMSSPPASPDIPPIPVVASESRTRLPLNIRAPTDLARTVSTHTGVTLNSSRRVVPETFSRPPHIPGHVTARRKPSLARTSLNSPSLSSLRKSFPAVAVSQTARAFPDFRAKQVPSSMPHIKCQGTDKPQPSGKKCPLCKRDLSYPPEGPISLPPMLPPVAVLPCGHTFHDHCLVLITPPDQSKNPPCIPCAMGEK